MSYSFRSSLKRTFFLFWVPLILAAAIPAAAVILANLPTVSAHLKAWEEGRK